MNGPIGQGRIDSASRVVDAHPDVIFAAFADPVALMQWLPPDGMVGRALEYDFREGGPYRIELAYPDGAQGNVGKTTARTDVTSGRFVALQPGTRIVQSVEFDSVDTSFAGEMILSWSFEPLPAGTRVTVTAQNVPEGISQADHDAGLRSSLENLARFVR